TGVRRDAAVGEDESVGLGLRRRGGGDVAPGEAVDLAALEEGGGGAEDEIHVTRDGAVREVLAAPVQQHPVLAAEEAEVAEHSAVGSDVDREGLAVIA